jgi:hypothetical protein
MRVYNLTDHEVVYRRRTLLPRGGSLEFPDLSRPSDRDLKLAAAGILAFGVLPESWSPPAAVRRTAPKAVAPELLSFELPVTKVLEENAVQDLQEDGALPEKKEEPHRRRR